MSSTEDTLSANYNWLSMTGFLIYCYSQSTVKSTEHNECVKIIPLRKYAMCLAATNESQKENQATVKTSDLSSVKMIIIYSRKGITAALNDTSARQARQANWSLLSLAVPTCCSILNRIRDSCPLKSRLRTQRIGFDAIGSGASCDRLQRDVFKNATVNYRFYAKTFLRRQVIPIFIPEVCFFTFIYICCSVT